MELTAREDIEASQERVFALLSDFDNIERQAMRRGTQITRTSDGPDAGPDSGPDSGPDAGTGAGMAWDALFQFRGKKRSAQITLSTYDPSERMVFDSLSGGLEMTLALDVVALAPNRTRINVTSTLGAKTLSARLFLQSIKLARGGIDKRFRKRVGELAGDMEKRLNSAA